MLQRIPGSLAAILAFASLGWAQPPASPTSESQPENQGNHAELHALPVSTPQYSSGYYPSIPDPNAGYLSGAADVIGAQAQFMTSKKEAELLEQQVQQARIDTRRSHIDEYLYERSALPTPEDERERLRIESLRRSRNNPPVNEIYSGKALNELLLALQQQLALNVRRPNVPLNPDIVQHLSVTTGSAPGSVGLLRDQGKLRWPLALKGEQFAELRDTITQAAAAAYQQAAAGNVTDDTVQAMTRATRELETLLKRSVDDVTPDDYIRGKRFVRDLENATKQLQDPNVTKYLTGKWAPRGGNVADLVKEMTGQGLKFAPALQGDEAAYVSLDSSLVSYMEPTLIAGQWDTMRK